LAGSGALKVGYLEKVVHENEALTEFTWTTADILRKGGAYTLLAPSNATEYPNPDLARLVSPFFYQDQDHAFFVEPWLTETTSEEWEGWLVTDVSAGRQFEQAEWWDDLELVAATAGSTEPCAMDASALFQLKPRQDWLTDSATALQVGTRLIGRGGGLDVAALRAAAGNGIKVVGGAGLNSSALRRTRRS
jgi:hypothetical protein